MMSEALRITGMFGSTYLLASYHFCCLHGQDKRLEWAEGWLHLYAAAALFVQSAGGGGCEVMFLIKLCCHCWLCCLARMPRSKDLRRSILHFLWGETIPAYVYVCLLSLEQLAYHASKNINAIKAGHIHLRWMNPLLPLFYIDSLPHWLAKCPNRSQLFRCSSCLLGNFLSSSFDFSVEGCQAGGSHDRATYPVVEFWLVYQEPDKIFAKFLWFYFNKAFINIHLC